MAPTVRDQGIILHGFADLQRALSRLDGGKSNFGLQYEFQQRLKKMGEGVAAVAPRFVTHKTGRHGDPSQPKLEDSVRVGSTARSVSVYSTASYGGAQQYGAGPKAGWGARGPHIQRSQASKWMTRAAGSQRGAIQAEADLLVEWVAREIERG